MEKTLKNGKEKEGDFEEFLKQISMIGMALSQEGLSKKEIHKIIVENLLIRQSKERM